MNNNSCILCQQPITTTSYFFRGGSCCNRPDCREKLSIYEELKTKRLRQLEGVDLKDWEEI